MKEKKKKKREGGVGRERERDANRERSLVQRWVSQSIEISKTPGASLRHPFVPAGFYRVCHCKSSDKSTTDEFAVSKFAIYKFAVKTYAAKWEYPLIYTGLPLPNHVFNLQFVVMAMFLS